MGGHQSKQSIDDTVDIVSSSISTQTITDSLQVTNVNNQSISGNNNFVSNLSQIVNVTVKDASNIVAVNDSTMQANVTDQIAQKIEDKGIAALQALDGSKTTISDTINKYVSNNVTSDSVVTCIKKYANGNNFELSGSNNYVENDHQLVVANMITDCSINQDSHNEFTTNITTAINQYSSSVSENPFAFITDTIQAIAKSGMMFIAVIFIVLLAFILLFKFLHKPKASDNVQVRYVQPQSFEIPTVPASPAFPAA
jgi:hypothetical protein